jgi:hypothetical protein
MLLRDRGNHLPSRVDWKAALGPVRQDGTRSSSPFATHVDDGGLHDARITGPTGAESSVGQRDGATGPQAHLIARSLNYYSV